MPIASALSPGRANGFVYERLQFSAGSTCDIHTILMKTRYKYKTSGNFISKIHFDDCFLATQVDPEEWKMNDPFKQNWTGSLLTNVNRIFNK